ncbi:MAG: peroxiredoxin [Bacteroidales bacterium]|nr:peroxiredoxin [Bacteroidales bacterium]MBR0111890.1 peroxiredoxin [Bacteroidales bacterium]
MPERSLRNSDPVMLKAGDKMPSFEVMDQDGKMVKSEDFIGKGKKTIIYFYPKDHTSGCTAEACSFRDNYAELAAAGYNVVGVSKDSAKSHTGFRAKYGLPFRLLADTTTEMLRSFGAWGEKKMYGKTTLGTLRRTFIFNENGILERIIEKVDTKNAAGQILEG